jgi:hypothetical protein
MTDLKDLFERALADGHGPRPGQDIDPAGDLARGRAWRRRRQRAGMAGLAAGSAVVALAAWAGVTAAGPSARPQAAPASQPSSASSRPANVHRPGQQAGPASQPIALVAYEGRQPPGYRVAEMPSGWVVQGGDPYALTIAPRNDPDQIYNSFTGKLVVMLQSADAGPPAGGISRPVDGRPGRFSVQGDTQILIFKGVDGRWVVIQAPKKLGWDSGRLARFAAGVQVLGNAEQSRG